MVKIVTGRINSYKTTRLKNHFDENQLGDGFISKKIMKSDLVYGYTLVQLSNKNETPFVIRDSFWDGFTKIKYKLGPYCFFEDAFEFLDKKIDEFISNNISPIYLDEVGILELNGQGYDHVLRKLIKNKTDLCLVVREDLLDQVCKEYGFIEVEII